MTRLLRPGKITKQWFPLKRGRGAIGSASALQAEGLGFESPRLHFPVIIARGKRLVPFRTQKLRLFAPMVLHFCGCGRVGRCRFIFEKDPVSKDAGSSVVCAAGVPVVPVVELNGGR